MLVQSRRLHLALCFDRRIARRRGFYDATKNRGDTAQINRRIRVAIRGRMDTDLLIARGGMEVGVGPGSESQPVGSKSHLVWVQSLESAMEEEGRSQEEHLALAIDRAERLHFRKMREYAHARTLHCVRS